MLPHLDAATTHRRSLLPDTEPSTAEGYLFNEAGLFLLDQGSLTQAIGYLQQSLTDFRRILGKDHPLTRVVSANTSAAIRSRK